MCTKFKLRKGKKQTQFYWILDLVEKSGHKSEKVFYNYIKASVKRKALQVAEHPFFN